MSHMPSGRCAGIVPIVGLVSCERVVKSDTVEAIEAKRLAIFLNKTPSGYVS